MVIFETSFYIQICTFCQNKLHICSKYYEGQERFSRELEAESARSKRIGQLSAPAWRTRVGELAADAARTLLRKQIPVRGGILGGPGFIEADRPEILLEPDSGR
jgi:hypothetical protein